MPEIQNSVIFQIYRGGVPGANATDKRAKLAKVVETVKSLGLQAVCFHGFPVELVAAWDGLAKLAEDNGLLAVASWGLDAETNNGKPFTGAEKGKLMGQVLKRASCAAGLADAEGRWDDGDSGKAGDVTNKQNAIDLGEALRKEAPNALVGDQCWFAIDSHGSLRSKPVANDPKDVFQGFPVDEFARKTVNWRQFRQAYCNQASFKSSYGTQRYRKIFDWMDRDWKLLEQPFAKAGLHYAPGVTIQAYGWDDMPFNLVDCVLTTCVTNRQPLIAWCDYAPSATVIAGVKALTYLREKGFATPGLTATAIVTNFQKDFNKTASKPLDVDGKAGLKTLAAMGITI